MRKTRLWMAAVFATMLLIAAPALVAQDTGKIHGHVQDAVGAAVPNTGVQLSTDGHTAKYTFKTDANGDYKGDGIAPGTYFVTIMNDQNKSIDQFRDVRITSGNDTLQDSDMSRAEYIAKMTPEQKKLLEAVKAKNAEVMKENGTIKNLNADLGTTRADIKSGNFAAAETLMLKDTQAKPDAAVLWFELGDAEKGLKKPDAAIADYKKALDLDAAGKKPNPDIQAASNDSIGELLAGQGKIPDSQAAYVAAATADPKNASMHYGNEAIMMDRAGDIDATVAAADKAIAADPTKPLPYYLKGKALINKATVDPKTQKIIAPPGCAEAYAKYVQLDPNGQFAADAKAILAQLGTVEATHYSAGHK